MVKLYLAQDNRIREAFAEEAFPFLRSKDHVISMVGAGGKTSLLYWMANYYSKKNVKTLVTTTTHVYQPMEGYVSGEKELLERWAQHQYAVVGEVADEHKLTMLPNGQLRKYMALAEISLLEADGAKRMSCKVPNENEPVLVQECDIVIGVMGLDVVGRPLKEACFRQEQAEKLLGVTPEHRLTEEDMAAILLSERGTRKDVGCRDYYIVLTKCENQQRRETGRIILELLQERGMARAVLADLR